MMSRFALALLFTLASGAVTAQEALVPGQPAEGTTASGDSDAYAIALDADQFVLGRAMQIDADVVVTVTGPDGEAVGEFDESARGADPFQFVTEASGTYTITITPFEDAEGSYALEILRSEPVATTPEGIVDQQYAVLDSDDSPGVVVAIVERGELVFAKPFGMASLTYGVPYTLDTPTNIGSTSKQFTAFAITLLAEQGKLGLDDDIRTHISELPDLGETVTIRHLLTHTSGYREFLNALAMSGVAPLAIERHEVIALIQRQPELQNTPGTEWNYNNTAFALLATVVERVTGEGFPEWMRANVFLPLGMNNTYVRETPTTVIPGRASGYTAAEGGGWEEVPDLGGAMGAGGIYSTAPDLAKWMDNYRTAGLGGENVIAQMTTPYVLASGDTTNYGFGLFIDEVRGQRRFQHGGADMAHRSDFGYMPDIESGIIVLSNTPSIPNAVAQVANAFFADHFTPEDEDADAPEASGEDFDPESFDPETFDAYAGRYELEEMPGFILTFRREDDRYFTQATGQSEVEIFPISQTTFELRVVPASVTFNMSDDGSVPTITLHQGGDHPATRLPDDEAEAAPLADYAGRYFSVEMETFYTVEVSDDELHLIHRRFDEPVTLTHSTGDDFTGGFPIATVDFSRDEEGAVTGFRAGSGRTRDVWFEKVETP